MKYLFSVLLLCCFNVYAQTDILSEIDSVLTFSDNDFSGQFTFAKEIPGNSTKDVQIAQIYRRDSEKKFSVIILRPAEDSGKGYLQINNNMWVYDPSSGRFTVTSAKDRFQNYPFRTSDFSNSTLSRDYDISSTEEAVISGMKVQILELNAKSDNVPFAKKKIWVNEQNLILKVVDYSYSGQILRTIMIPKYKKIDNHYIAVNLIIIDALKYKMVDGKKVYEKTTIVVENPSTDDVPDSYYTQAFLERFGN